MKKVSACMSTGILFAIIGCSGVSEKRASNTAVQVAPVSVVAASTTPVEEAVAPLPVPSLGQVSRHVWRSENVKDQLGNAVALKATSLDGKFDLVILQRGPHPFLSLVRHARWESVHNSPAKGRLMYLRAKFEDGREKRMEWDELGFGTENPYSVLWSYPVKTDAPIGPAPEASAGSSFGGDQLLVEEMMQHKTMLLEVEPGVTTQFDMTGLARAIGKARTSQRQPVLEASQIEE
jgi:hypothetical protein